MGNARAGGEAGLRLRLANVAVADTLFLMRRWPQGLLWTVLAAGFALHCGAFSGTSDGTGQDAGAAPIDGAAGVDGSQDASLPTDAGRADTGASSLQWVQTLVPSSPSGKTGAIAFAGGLVKHAGSASALTVVGTYKGILASGPSASASDATDLFAWKLSSDGAPLGLLPQRLPGDRYALGLVEAEQGAMYVAHSEAEGANPPIGFSVLGQNGFDNGTPIAGNTTGNLLLSRGGTGQKVIAAVANGGGISAGWLDVTAAPGSNHAVRYLARGVPSAMVKVGNAVVLGGVPPANEVVGCSPLSSHLGAFAFLYAVETGKLQVAGATSCLWSGRFTSTDVAASSMKITTLAGPHPSAPAGSRDFVVVGTAKGAISYDQSGGPGSPKPYDAGAGSLFVARIAETGTLLAFKLFPGEDLAFKNQTHMAAQLPDGRVVIGGWLRAASDFGGGKLPFTGGEDAFYVELDQNLNYMHDTSFGDGKSQRPHAIAVGDDNAIYMTGAFQGSLGLGGVTSPGDTTSVFVAKFLPH